MIAIVGYNIEIIEEQFNMTNFVGGGEWDVMSSNSLEMIEYRVYFAKG